MNLRAIPRTAVDRYLKVARWPVDTTLALLGRNGAATSAIDRIDATFREAAALALGDQELREDARRRREAAAERDRSARLRDEADLREERGQELSADHASCPREQDHAATVASLKTCSVRLRWAPPRAVLA